MSYRIYSVTGKVLKEGTFNSKNENEQRKFFESFIGEFNDPCYMVFLTRLNAWVIISVFR